MKRHKKVYFILAAVVILAAIGTVLTIRHLRPKDLQEAARNHRAMELYREGVWETRFMQISDVYAIDKRELELTVDVRKEMSEQDMVEILDYYEMVTNAAYDKENREVWLGEKDWDYACYAVFYQADTDEEIRRFKFVNRELVDIDEEKDQYRFRGPGERSQIESEKIGEY